MAVNKVVLGHIDCPACGAAGMMRVTHDKNGAPFGYCEECAGQLRIGGDRARVAAFVRRYPWAAAPVTDTAEKPAATVAAPVTDTAARMPRRSGFDLLLNGA